MPSAIYMHSDITIYLAFTSVSLAILAKVSAVFIKCIFVWSNFAEMSWNSYKYYN